MEKFKAKELSFNEIRSMYRAYLQNQKLSANTVNTASADTFYLWRKGSKELFWNVVTSIDFETEAKNALNKVLQENSKGNVNSLVCGYVSHLRRFRTFLNTIGDIDISSAKPVNHTTGYKAENKKYVPTPTKEQAEEYLLKWTTLENYQMQERALNKLFFELCPYNDNIEDVLLKASALNDFYSTNIFSVYPVAKHIYSLDIDTRLKAGDAALVSDVGEVVIGGIQKNFYSFATKYCSHHNPLEYPIYDSYVGKILCYFRNRDGFSDFNDTDLKNYVQFKSILIEFRAYYGLEKYNLKQIDQYIWQLGKDYFPKNYKKEKSFSR